MSRYFRFRIDGYRRALERKKIFEIANRINSKEIYNENPDQRWAHMYQHNKHKLVLMILLYVFSTDDGKISRKELRTIKAFFKDQKEVLTKADKLEIYPLAKHNFSLNDFIEYMAKHEYKAAILNEAVDIVTEIVFRHAKYLLILEELKEKYDMFVN